MVGMKQIGPEGDVQCSAFFFFPILLVILALNASVLSRGKGNPMISNCFTALVLACFVFMVTSGTAVLTYMHLSLGMIATEGALRLARAPMWAISTRLELFAVVCTIIPNLSIVLSESIFWHCNGVNMLTCVPRPLNTTAEGSFASNPLYRKQHAVLHTAIVGLMVSLGSTYWPRIRKSPKVQLVRLFVDPACLVAVANILATHDHGAAKHELNSHPALAVMMYAVSACMFFSNAMQLAAAPGTDLTVKLDHGRGAPSGLLVPRLVASFSALILGNFLYVDSAMEYLGCRTVLIKPGGDDNKSRLGLSPTTELSTYLSITTMLAVGMMAAMVLVNPTVTGLDEYTTLSSRAALSPAEVATLIDKEEEAAGVEVTPSASSEDIA